MDDVSQILLLGILAGADNVQVAAAISMAPLTRARRALFALAFALCEISTPLLGLVFFRALEARYGSWLDQLAPFIVAACGVVIIVLALKDRDELEHLVNHRGTLATLPLLLSLDNLLIGVSLGTMPFPLPLAAATIGAVSASMCVLGIAGGARVRRWIPEHASVISGLYLFVIAGVMWTGSHH
jgi:putative Mn2+ efflux pump MntP